MSNIQVRVPDDMEDDLDELAEHLQASRSEAIRNALTEGLRALRQQRALARYAAGEVSLARAAEEGRTSLYVMAEKAREAGTPYHRYPAGEVERDAAVAGRFVKRPRSRRDR